MLKKRRKTSKNLFNKALSTFYYVILVLHNVKQNKEKRAVLFNNALNTFYYVILVFHNVKQKKEKEQFYLTKHILLCYTGVGIITQIMYCSVRRMVYIKEIATGKK